jgi:lambda family phage portal protein
MLNAFRAIADTMNQPSRSSGRGGFRSSSSYAGGGMDRMTADWAPWTMSPDWETRSVLRFMRARARQLVRDNGYCSGFVSSVSDNIVGHSGIMLQAKVRDQLGKLARSTNKEIERAWSDWSEPENCSADGYDSWIDIQRIFVETMAVDGEILLRRLKGFDNKYNYAVQLIDSDLLDETYNVPAGPGQNEIRMGIELDTWRRRVAYHIWSRYPSDLSGQDYRRERIPADQIIHRFIRWRPNQMRGLTWFAPVMVAMHHMGNWSLNEVIASRAGAAKMGFILNKQAAAIEGFEWKKADMRQMDVEPGLIEELMPGQEFAQFDPSHPATTYDQFEMAMLRSASRGLKVSQLTMTGDLRQANYSSMRAGWIPERDRWRVLQTATSMHCHRLIYRDWISVALLSPELLSVDSRLGSNYHEVMWKGRGWQFIDPLKDLEALKMGVDLGVDSRQHANAEQGRDFEDVVEELAYEQEFADETGVDVSGNQIAGINPLRVSPEGEQDDTAEPKTGEGTDEPQSPKDDSENSPTDRPSRGAEAARERRALRVMAGGIR